MATFEKPRNILLMLAVILGSTEMTLEWRPFRLINHNVTAYSFSDVDVSLNATVVGLEGISIFIEIKREIQQPFIRFEVSVDSGDGLFDSNYLNETIDMCRFFRNKSYLPFVQMIYRLLVEQGNYPTSCPVKKKLYKAVNMKLDVEKLPPTLPTKTLSITAVLSKKVGSIMQPLMFYKVFTKIVQK